MLKDEALQAFIQETTPMLNAYCKSQKQKPEDIENIVNEAYFRYWQQRDNHLLYSKEQNLKWLYGAINFIIKEQHNTQNKHQADALDFYENKIVSPDDLDDDMIYKALLAFIKENLNDSEYDLFERAILKKQSNTIIAKQKGLEQGTVRTRIMRLKRKLSEIIKKFENF